MTYHALLFNVVDKPFLSRTLGVYRVAHYLRDQGFDIEVIDYANYWTLDQLKQLFKSRVNKQTKFIGFSHLFSIWSPILEEFCQWVKQNYPDLFIVSGGGVMPYFESRQIDYYIKGFGECGFLALLKWKLSNGPRPRFKLTFDQRKIIDANESYPAFKLENLMVKYQDRDFVGPDEWLMVEFSRGCKFKCKFCTHPMIGVKTDYSRPAEDFAEQLQDAYDRFGVTNYLVSDDTFNDSTEKVIKFADAVETLSFKPWMSGYARADLIISRKGDREHLARMNYFGHYYGIESFHRPAAKAIGKGMDSDRLQEGLIEIKDYFMKQSNNTYLGTISLIVGLPGETEESIINSRQWLMDNWLGQAYNAYTLDLPKPKTPDHMKSELALNLETYGYREMTEEEVQASHVTDDIAMAGAGVDQYCWKNDNLDYFGAKRLVKTFVDQKVQNNFKGDNFTLANRLTNPMSVKDLLSLSYKQHREAVDYNGWIPLYIEKKLSL